MAWFSQGLYGQAIIVKPYLQNAFPNEITIMWESNVEVSAYVDWGSSPFDLNQATPSFTIVGNGNSRIHEAKLTGLAPLTKYFYKIRLASGATSDIYRFITPPVKSSDHDINFVAMSDMQRDGGNPGVYQSLIENGILPVVDTALANGVDDLLGLIIPGDLVQTGGNYGSWKSDFFDLGDSLTTLVPIYPVPGNHEYYGDGLPNFIKYFSLPLNGSPSKPEEWWYKDFSNVRLIGLNSNGPTNDLSAQLTWLQSVLDEAGNDADIDFVFAQLHHPYKSELWVPGELDFTGDVITLLENFTTLYKKPSLHFFGHTHAYSRGVSRDHNHLWVNVATAGGAIDNWGEFPNADYEEFSISEDDYGFCLMQVKAGAEPSFRLRRFSRGDQNTTKNNSLSDEIMILKYKSPPATPLGIYPQIDSIATPCVLLKASAFNDGPNTHQASHWQVSEDCNFANNNTFNSWKQVSNWYNEVNSQANDDLSDEAFSNLLPDKQYCWRVRYRDQYMVWSAWSQPLTFYTKAADNSNTPNLLSNGGAEDGISFWTGNIEALTSNECSSVPVYAGTKFFAVGGVCSNEQSVGFATQNIDVASYASGIDNGLYAVDYSAFMRAYASGNDLPEMYLEFLDASLSLLATSPVISNGTASWLQKSMTLQVPSLCRTIKVVLKGTRLAGSDNDSYFDEVSTRLTQLNCPSCIGSKLANATDSDGDGICDNLDCDDNDAQKFQGNVEICDGKDNDCDGHIESGDEVVWTGLGNGISWSDGNNWNQGFCPLPCQHVSLPLAGSVKLTGTTYIKSLRTFAGNELFISNGAELHIDGASTSSAASVYIGGSCTNQGKITVRNSAHDGLKVTGQLTNEAGRIYIDDILLNDISIVPGGQLINHGVIEMKE